MTLLTKLKQTWNQRIHQIKGDDNEYFASFYPGNAGTFPAFIFSKIFNRIKIETRKTERLNRLNEKGVVIYVGKHQSLFEFLYYQTTLKNLALPYPEIAFDMKFFFYCRFGPFSKSSFPMWTTFCVILKSPAPIKAVISIVSSPKDTPGFST